MQMNNTVRIIFIYLLCMIAGQAAAVGVGLALDSYSETVALSVFIPDNAPAVAASKAGDSGSRAKVATWLLAPAVLALDFAD
jgi:hypothetical protein